MKFKIRINEASNQIDAVDSLIMRQFSKLGVEDYDRVKNIHNISYTLSNGNKIENEGSQIVVTVNGKENFFDRTKLSYRQAIDLALGK